MAGGISIHVVDVSRGVLGTGMKVEVFSIESGRTLIAGGSVSSKGTLDEPALAREFPPGAYEAVFHVAEFFRATEVTLATVPFLDVVAYRFGINDPAQHTHLPFKVTPWGYSCFRGGA